MLLGQLRKLTREPAHSFAIWFQIRFVAGDNEAALAGLGVFQTGERRLHLRDEMAPGCPGRTHLNDAVAEEVGDDNRGQDQSGHGQEESDWSREWFPRHPCFAPAQLSNERSRAESRPLLPPLHAVDTG